MKAALSFRLFLYSILFCFGFLAGAPLAYAQQVTYGNEWINYNQKYYKIKVPTTGIYRLDKAYLQAAGINGVDPRNFQLYRRGQEVAIHVEGEADGSFDANDFIEFYGEKNDGALDRELYKDPDANHINPYYSLYTDTAAYFLTWSTAPGKRMAVVDQNPAGLSPEPWHWQENIIFDNGEYSRGKRYGENYMSWMDAGEGYTGGSTSGFTYNLPGMASNIFTGDASPKVEIAFVGANDNNHQVDVFVRPLSGPERLIGTVSMISFGSVKQEFPLVTGDFHADGKLVLRITAKNTASRFRTIYFKTIYPQKNTISTAGLTIKNQNVISTPAYYLFEGSMALGTTGYDVTASDNVKRIVGSTSGTQKGFVFPAGFRSGFLWSGTNLVPPAPREVRFRSLTGTNASYVIISHESLMQPVGTSANPVKEYAAYRNSAAGGGYDTLVMEVGLLYDQYFYGDKSPAAIRRFMKYLLNNGKPQYLFIIGKALEADNINVRNKPASLSHRDLVPTGGTPGSDVFFTADWDKGNYAPKVPTGRIPANTPQEVLNYLKKVQTHESLAQNVEWRKNILHLGGGIEGSERTTLASYLRSYEQIAEGKWLGANVITKIRSSVAGLDTINVAKELNAGLSLITFFGHSSTTTSDLDIGLVSNVLSGYNNTGKYPMILMNGCNVGNSYVAAKSFGEDWLLTADKGALAFLGHASYGYPSLLNIFSSNFYKVSFSDPAYYGKPLGVQHQQAIEEVAKSISGDNTIAMEMQMILQSDPAVVLVAPEKADYVVHNGGASVEALDGGKVTATSESFILSLDVKNLGKVNESPFYISVTRKLENGTELVYDKIKVPSIYYRDTLKLELAARTTEAAGINTFKVKLDYTDTIPELEEGNNEYIFDAFFSRSGVVALTPHEYGIVSASNVKLVGQSTDLLSAARDYYFEIDTTATFKSQWKQSRVVNAAVLPVWDVQLPTSGMPRDSMVYFWRLRYNTFNAGEDTVWATSSFRFIPGSSNGWSQAHFGQLSKATLQRIELNSQANKLEFAPLYKSIMIKGGGGALGMSRSAPFGIFIDNNAFFWDNCGYTVPNMLVMVFDNVSLEPYTNMPANTGSRCGLAGTYVYQFGNLSTVANQDRLEAFLKAVPQGYHVAMVGINNIPYQAFKASLKEAFKGIGSVVIDNLKNGDPFAILGQKGAQPGTALEAGGNDADSAPRNMQAVQIEKLIEVNDQQGTMTSTLIGPAREWKSLHHQMKLEPSDSYRLDVLGVNQENQETVIASNVTSSNFSLEGVDVNAYPYLRLRVALKDEAQRTAPQVSQWTVLYEGVPEGVMRPDLVGLDKYQKLSEQAASGEVNLPFAFHNISKTNFGDSLTVETTLFEENGTRTVKSFKVEPLQKEDTVYFNHKFSTLNMKGTNRLRVTVNPRILPEQNYLNNTLEISFNSQLAAGLPPVVDVAFDGVRILDGEIVSPSPLISIVLKDNSRKMPITEPTSLKVYLKKPGGDFEELDVRANPAIRWFPADDKNDFRVEYHPERLENGTYTLEVQGFDALGQRAGSERYSVNFEVVNESTISNFYPYPNPFSSKTRFIFTLTGSKIPDRMKLQIMTMTGKVIREIQKEELGAIKIGNNISEFAWDGTDEFGDRLANGVYLYRVVVDNGPEEMKHRYTEGDKAFKNGYGKIYILR
ncbi:putative type IX secretion system sortase PorU2 [Rufibacter psychrotolerans]|uniref:putative type IX secretion system sortase PorU2 n=1 Tax=Rufibacter psychrotolerans TaxID=2812556 RepID=UPI0019684183|nr:C25 family cysteine peptidase [Rufibacter sp. SYSU D00308]